MLRFYAAFALACSLLAPASALALDASNFPPVKGKSVETPSLVLRGGITCPAGPCDGSVLSVTPSTSAATGTLARLIADRAPLASPYLVGVVSATAGGACDSSAWNGYFTSTFGPIPRDYCTKSAGSISILYPGLNGLGNEAGNAVTPGDTTYQPMAQHLVQAVTTQDNTRQETASGINFRIRTGGGGLPQTQHNQKVAFSVFTRVEPGGGNGWGINTDLHVLSGVGNYAAAGREADHTNFNGDYAPGGCNPCQPGQINNNFWGDWLSFVGFPVTAGTYYQGVANGPAPFNGTLTAGSNVITNVAAISGTQGSRTPYFGEMLTSGGSIPAYTYVTGISGSTVTMSQAATASGFTSITTTGFNMHYGVLFSGAQLVRDQTISDQTNSQTSLLIGGSHFAGVNTTQGTMPYALLAAAGQAVCLNGLDGCWSYIGTNATAYKQNGGSPLFLLGTLGGVNGVGLTSAGTGAGPLVSPNGPDANITLDLTAKGTSPVRVLSGLTALAGISAPSLPTAAGTAKGSLCVDTTGVVYVRTSPGACIQ